MKIISSVGMLSYILDEEGNITLSRYKRSGSNVLSLNIPIPGKGMFPDSDKVILWQRIVKSISSFTIRPI